MRERPFTSDRRRRLRRWLLSLAAAAGLTAGAIWAFGPDGGCDGGPAAFDRVERMPSDAMAPTLGRGELLWVNRRAFCRLAPKRGDLAMVAPPHADAEAFVLRIVGLPGDRVELRRGQLFLNGEAVERQWLESAMHTDAAGATRQANRFLERLPGGAGYQVRLADLAAADETTPALTVPPDHYFLLGDNRDLAEDSRAFGALARRDIIARPAFILWSPSWDRVGRRLR